MNVTISLCDERRPKIPWNNLFWMFIAVIVILLGIIALANAQDVNMQIIRKIESNGNNKAISRCRAIGAYQIMPCVLQEYNDCHKDNWAGQNHRLTQLDLFYYDTNFAIAYWYINKRIPQMLKWYGKPITIDNILWAYNSGIGNFIKNIKPKETINYIKKYHKLERSIK